MVVDDIPGYIEAATTLSGWIQKAGTTPVIYGTGAMKNKGYFKETMNKVNWVKLYCTNLVHIQVRNYKINNGVRYISRYCWTKLIKIKK